MQLTIGGGRGGGWGGGGTLSREGVERKQPTLKHFPTLYKRRDKEIEGTKPYFISNESFFDSAFTHKFPDFSWESLDTEIRYELNF